MLMIGTPCYGGQVTIQYMLAMMRLKDALGAARIPMRLVTPAHDSLVTRARNRIANACLHDPDCAHLLFIDADLDFPAALVPHLLGAGKDVVCGVYPVKGLDLSRVMAQGPDITPEAGRGGQPGLRGPAQARLPGGRAGLRRSRIRGHGLHAPAPGGARPPGRRPSGTALPPRLHQQSSRRALRLLRHRH